MNLADVEDQLFFIVGCPRSGTTLVQLMVSNHPDAILPPETGFYSMIYHEHVHTWGELTEAANFDRAIEATLNSFRIKDLALDAAAVKTKCRERDPSWETIFLSILAVFAEKHGARRIGEKSPYHFQYLGLLKERFPRARFIHVIRDPRAVVHSLMGVPFGSRRVGDSCNRWRSAIDAHKEYAEVLGADRYLAVRYEELVSEPEAMARRICEFLELEFSARMLEPHEREVMGFNERYAEHMSNTLKPIFTSSVDKWKNALTSSQIAIIQCVLREEMALLGYEPIEATAILPGARYRLDLLAYGLERRLEKARQRVTRMVRGTRRSR